MKSLVCMFLAFICWLFVAGTIDAQSLLEASRFQAPGQKAYTLDEGDTLGVFVEGVVGEFNSMPPVHQPAANSDLPPAMGYPTLVLHDGTIRLPLVDPIPVRGHTVAQVETLLKKAFRQGDKPIITDRSRVIVSLIRKRTINVIVVRGDQSQARSDARLQQQNQSAPVSARSDGSGRIYNLNLPAGDNDLLNAMMLSGGLPGVNAQDSLHVLRKARPTRDFHESNIANNTPFPRSGSHQRSANVPQSFPLRDRGRPFPRSQARLGTGDIVTVAARPTEVYYTGGLLGGGEFPLPRDRPLSVMDAILLAGGIPQSRQTMAIPLQQPRALTLLRQRGGQQVAYSFDLATGYSQRAALTEVRPGDYLILDYSSAQRLQNVGIGVLNTYGLRQVLRN